MKCKRGNQRGIVLFAVLGLSAMLTLIASTFLSTAHTAVRTMRNWRRQDECFLAAQSAVERAKWELQVAFRNHFQGSPLARTARKFEWFDTHGSTYIGSSNPYTAPQNQQVGDATVSVSIDGVVQVGNGKRDVLLSASASIEESHRTIQELVRYELDSSGVFDYAYFVNNFGWFWGSPIHAFGDVRANGNFSCRYGPKVHGDVIAAINPALSAAGSVDGSWSSWSLPTYYSYAHSRARPGDPPHSSYSDGWRMGYDGDPREFEELSVLDMPYLGDLSEYESIAQAERGEVKLGNKRVFREIYDGDGPDETAGTPDDGMLILEGTANKPIVVDGPVVVRGDVVLKGFITGQGTIYSGRNIHFADDVTYVNPPAWIKPDNDPELTADDNRTRDFIGYAAKGNIIIGDYTSSTWYNNCGRYMRPSFTKSYETDPSDAPLGYDSDGDPGNGYVFNGDYTAYDGGQKLDRYGNVNSRRYFQSSNDDAFRDTNPSNSIDRIDGVCYTNHVTGGYVGSLTMNGSLVSRDEAINFQGTINLNWDIRLGSESQDAMGIDIYLPRSLQKPQLEYWREI